MPLNEAIAQAYENLGRARAATLGTIGQTIAAIPQQMQQQRFENLQAQNLQGQIDERTRALRNAAMVDDTRRRISGLMADPTVFSPDGTLNAQALTQRLSQVTPGVQGPNQPPDASTLFSIIDPINESLSKGREARAKWESDKANAMVRVANGALLLGQKDGDYFGHATSGLAALQHSGWLTSDEVNGLVVPMVEHQEQLPTMLQQIVSQGNIPPIKLGKDEQLRSGLDPSKVLASNVVQPGFTLKPGETRYDASGKPMVSLPNEMTPAEQENARHNKAMEEIEKLKVGRAEAAQAETARHDRAMETAANPFAAMMGGGTGQGGGQPLSMNQIEGPHGDDYLKTLPVGVASEVKAYAEGRRPFPAGFALKSPYFQSLIQMVGQYDPTFDAVNYNARAKTRQDFTSGASAKNINALNTAIGHLDQLSNVSDQLGNFHEGSLGPLTSTANTLANALSRASGSSKVTNFQSVVKPVADELTRVWRQAGGTEADIKDRMNALSASNTPEQLHGAIAEIGHLLESKLNALNTQYAQGMGTTDTTGMQIVTPQARQVLDKLEARAGGNMPATTPTLNVGQVVNVKGKRVRVTAVHPDGTFDGDEVK